MLSSTHAILTVDPREFCVSPETPIRDLLPRISRSKYFFQLVVDTNSVLLGTVTDGDVRRALLQGLEPDEAAHACMRARPVVGRFGEDTANRAKLEAVRGPTAFVPILDTGGRVQSVLVLDKPNPGLDTALLMAGGFGKRLGSRTQTTPKPLLPVGGKPMIQHMIERLAEAKVRHLYISVCYLKEQFEEFVDQLKVDLEVTLIEEAQPLGTAGVLGEISERIHGPILMMNGDILTKTDFRAMMSFHHHLPYNVTIGAARYDIHVPYGVIDYDAGGRVHNLREKPRHTYFVAAGIYILGPETCRLVGKNTRIDMPDLLSRAIASGISVGTFPIHEYWLDLGRPADLEAAEMSYFGD